MLYSLDFTNFKKTILAKHSSSMKALIIVYSKIIKERSSSIKEWLVKSIEELSAMIVRI